MARKQSYVPGWYDTGNGQFRWFDGATWANLGPAANNPESPRGWYQTSNELFRWWTGKGWGDQYSRRDGKRDVVKRVHEAIVSTQVLGGGDVQAIQNLLGGLVDWPPLRVKTLHSYTSAIAAGTNLVAVVEWDGPED
jgi:hypothetical protein